MNFDSIEEKWIAFAGSIKDPLHVVNVRSGKNSFRSFISEIGEDFSFTKNEFNMYIERFKNSKQVYYVDFKRVLEIVRSIKTEMRLDKENIKDKWSQTTGSKGLAPLYYDKAQEPSFYTLLKSITSSEIKPEDMSAICVLFGTKSTRRIKFEEFEFFFSSRKWISESRAEIEWWFPQDSILSQSVVTTPSGAVVLRSIHQIASLQLDTQMSFLKGTKLRTKQGPSASLVHFLEAYRDKTNISTEELDNHLEKSIKSHMVRERASKYMSKMLLFYDNILPSIREQCLRLATRLTNRRLKRSNIATSEVGRGKSSGRKQHDDGDDDHGYDETKSFNQFIVKESFLGALLWNTKLNAQHYDEHVLESEKKNSKPRIEDITLDMSSQRYWSLYWEYCNQDEETQAKMGNRKDKNTKLIQHFETRYATLSAESTKIRHDMQTEIRQTIQEIQHAMGISKGQDNFRKRIQIASRTKWKPGMRQAAKFYVKAMRECMESTIGLNVKDANTLCKDYVSSNNENSNTKESKEERDDDDDDGGVGDLQKKKKKKKKKKSLKRNADDLMKVDDAALRLHPVCEISESIIKGQRGKATFHWESRGRLRYGFRVNSFLQHASEKHVDEDDDNIIKSKSSFHRILGSKKKKKKSLRKRLSSFSSIASDSLLLFRDVISEFETRFARLSRKDADQKIVCDAGVLTLISPSDFKIALMYVLEISGQDAAKFYKRLFPVISFESETIKPFRFVGWGQLDVPRRSPLYRYGPPITLESFKYTLPQSEAHETSLRSIERACLALRERLVAVEARDAEIESEAKRQKHLLEEKQRQHVKEQREISSKKGRGWCGFG